MSWYQCMCTLPASDPDCGYMYIVKKMQKNTQRSDIEEKERGKRVGEEEEGREKRQDQKKKDIIS